MLRIDAISEEHNHVFKFGNNIVYQVIHTGHGNGIDIGIGGSYTEYGKPVVWIEKTTDKTQLHQLRCWRCLNPLYV